MPASCRQERKQKYKPVFLKFSEFRRLIYLQLSQSETTAGTDTAVVLDGRAVHNGTQLVHRTGSNGSSLGETVFTTTVLPAGLFGRKI